MNENVNRREATEEDSIDLLVLLGDLWRGIIKFWWIVVLFALLVGGIQFYRSYIRFEPIYTCSATYTVQTENTNIGGDDNSDAYTFNYNKYNSNQLEDVFPYIVKSDVVTQKVCLELGTEKMPAKISATCVPESNMVTLTAKGTDPELTYATLKSVEKNYSSVSEYIIGRTKLITISEPVLPVSPSNSGAWVSSVAKGAAVGMLIGLLWIGVYAFLRRTIRTKEDIRTKLNKNCLGVLPLVTFKKYRKQISTSILIDNPRIGDDFLESMRLLRSSVLAGLGENGQVIMVTSTAPGEGKTVTALNLSAMLAKNENSVLIIDCDLRKSGIKDALNITDDAGEDVTDEKYMIRNVESLGIDLLTFCSKWSHPRNIMRVDFLKPLINEMRSRYDYIVIDTPPSGIISEVATVARVADGLVYVIRQDAIMQNSIRAGIGNILSDDEVKMLGCVLNGATGGYGGYGSYYKYRGYHGYYRSGYGKRYGYGYGYGNEHKHRKTGR